MASIAVPLAAFFVNKWKNQFDVESTFRLASATIAFGLLLFWGTILWSLIAYSKTL